MNFILSALVSLILAISSGTALAETGADSVLPDLRVVAQGAMQGRLIPEGCGNRKSGGLSRQKTIVDRVAAPIGKDRSLIINTGDNFSVQQQPSLGLASMYLKTFSLLNAACMAVGMSELELGPDVVSAAGEGTLPLVASNIADERWTGILEPFVLIQRNGLQVLLVSVLDPDLVATNPDLNVTLADPVTAVREIRESTPHEMLILVAHAKLHRAEEIALQAGKVDIVIQAAKLESPLCRSMDDSGPGGEGIVFMANRSKGATVAFADIKRKPNGFELLDQGIITVAMQESEDPQALLLMQAYEVWNRKDRLRRPDDGYFAQIGGNFNYMEFLKQKNIHQASEHAD